MEWVIGVVLWPSNPLTLHGLSSGAGFTPRNRSIVFMNLVSINIYPLAPVSMREEAFIPSPLLLTIHGRVNAFPPSNWLKSTSATSTRYGPEEETFFRGLRFLILRVPTMVLVIL